jgi:hypothetical protein
VPYNWRLIWIGVPLLAACASAAPHSSGPYTRLDKDTEYNVEDRPGGFRLSVSHARYQFIPSPGEAREACRTTVSSLAYDIAARRGRRIRPVTSDRIRVDTARNGFTGVTSCSASATVEYE